MAGVSAPNGWSSSWWAISAQCAAGLVLYVTTSLSAGVLSGSAVLGVVVSGPVLLGAVVSWRRWGRGTHSLEPGPTRAHEPGFWALALVGSVVCFFGGQSLAVWLHGEYGSPAFDTAQSAQGATPVPLLLFALVVAAPVGEEALMRGLIYPLLRRRWSVVVSALVSSLAFAVLHGNVVQVAVTLPLGMLLAFVYEHVNRLWPVIVLHSLFNLASILVPVDLIAVMATPVVFSMALAGVVTVLAVMHPSADRGDRGEGALSR